MDVGTNGLARADMPAEESVPGTPLTALPLNPMVQGGGSRSASGFPVMPDLHTNANDRLRIKHYRLEDCMSGVCARDRK
jgi:hypothetical protein